MPFKRKRGGPIKKYKSSGVTGKMRRRVFKKTSAQRDLTRRVNSLTSMIETKTGVWATASNVALTHNKLHVVQAPGSGQLFLNCLQTSQGVSDPSGSTQMANRIGDKISVRGVMFTGMFENAYDRPKVFYHFMLLKCYRGDVPTVATLYQNNSNNRLIDMINTERYTVVASKKFTIQVSNSAPSIANVTTGAPEETDFTTVQNAGMGTKLFKLWVPGRKFGNKGNVIYEGNGVACKFFDYIPVIMVYDWFGTPSGTIESNTIGKINSMYSKIYFKDA